MSSRKKGRRTAGTPDGACGHPERELPARPLRGFLATRSGECRFSSGKICREDFALLPERGRLHCGGVPDRSLVRSPQESPSPSTGAWAAGAKRPRGDHLWKEGKAREQKQKAKKKSRKKFQNKFFPVKIIYSNVEYRQYLE